MKLTRQRDHWIKGRIGGPRTPTTGFERSRAIRQDVLLNHVDSGGDDIPKTIQRSFLATRGDKASKSHHLAWPWDAGMSSKIESSTIQVSLVPPPWLELTTSDFSFKRNPCQSAGHDPAYHSCR